MKKVYEDGWFQVGRIQEGIYMISEPHHFQEVKSYLVVGERRDALIDTGMGIADIRQTCQELTTHPLLVINTHSHWDHIGGNTLFSEIAIHASEAGMLEKGVATVFTGEMTRENAWGKFPEDFDITQYRILPSHATMLLEEKDVIDLGGTSLTILHTPGHTQGSICLFEEDKRILFTGDTIYEGPLYAHFKNSNLSDYAASCRRLCTFSEKLKTILPSHNRVPLKPSFLCDVASAFEEVVSGKAEAERREGFSEALFGNFSILFK